MKKSLYQPGKSVLAFALALILVCFSAAPAISDSSEAAAKTNESADKTPAADDVSQYKAKDIIAKMDELMRGDTNYSEMEMVIHNPDWPKPRKYAMVSWEERVGKKSFIRITEPASERGKAFLKIDTVFKIYIPTERENKPLTIPPSLMLQPWMGSDFTNDDLVRESSIVDDYFQAIEAIEYEDGVKLIRVRLDPREEAAVVWGKIVSWVRAEDFIPVRHVYYDEDGVKVRQMNLSEIKDMSGRKIPTVWEMVSLEEDKLGRRTILKLVRIDFNVKISPSTFTDKNLTRRDWD